MIIPIVLTVIFTLLGLRHAASVANSGGSDAFAFLGLFIAIVLLALWSIPILIVWLVYFAAV